LQLEKLAAPTKAALEGYMAAFQAAEDAGQAVDPAKEIFLRRLHDKGAKQKMEALAVRVVRLALACRCLILCAAYWNVALSLPCQSTACRVG
jgi:hypothetical protein